MKLTTALLLVALCVFAQSVAADRPTKKVGHDDDGKCEDWVGDGGCKDCKFPYKCCAQIVPVCFAECLDDKFCVEDPEWCVDKLVEDCKNVPKQVCTHKPVCDKVKNVVCKDIKDEKCDIVIEKVCKNVKDCKKVPVQKCDKVCDFKDVCDDDDDDGGSFAAANAFARGGNRASASSFASAGDDDATAIANADADGDDAFTVTNALARVFGDDDRRRLLGCKRTRVCDDKCVTVHEDKCETKHVCDDVPKTVCKPVVQHKCHDEWHDVCKNVKKCDWIDEKVCKLVKIKVCKEETMKCGPYDCKEYEKCNPECCPDTKVATCVELY